jgi:hypothetical protein
MATIVGGIGSPHSPMLEIPPGKWRGHGDLEQDSLRRLPIVSSSRTPDDLATELELDLMTDRHVSLQNALARLSEALLDLSPDVLVIVGDDQRELFLDDCMPAVSVFWGDKLWDRPPGLGAYPATMDDAYRWYHAEVEEPYITSPELGRHLLEHFVDADFDVAQFSEQPDGRSLGHAFTFIYRRLLGGRDIPLVPVMLNTYFPPNQPSPRRCLAIGRALADGIRSWPEEQRVVLVASGGLSHPIIDEELDRTVLNALVSHDEATLSGLPLELLVEGSSEIRNWLAVGAALSDADAEVVDYVPAYRSLAGSGCGMGFVVWRAR